MDAPAVPPPTEQLRSCPREASLRPDPENMSQGQAPSLSVTLAKTSLIAGPSTAVSHTISSITKVHRGPLDRVILKLGAMHLLV
jgi:hypothetical protein